MAYVARQIQHTLEHLVDSWQAPTVQRTKGEGQEQTGNLAEQSALTGPLPRVIELFI